MKKKKEKKQRNMLKSCYRLHIFMLCSRKYKMLLNIMRNLLRSWKISMDKMIQNIWKVSGLYPSFVLKYQTLKKLLKFIFELKIYKIKIWKKIKPMWIHCIKLQVCINWWIRENKLKNGWMKLFPSKKNYIRKITQHILRYLYKFRD